MRSVRASSTCVLAGLTFTLAVGGAQERPNPKPGDAPGSAASSDPRVGLKAGLKDAGQAARNMELLASLPKPEGFFDPKSPAGEVVPPERNTEGRGGEAAEADESKQPPETPQQQQQRASFLSFANSDLAFQGHHLFMGNFNGFNVYDIENPKKPKLLSSVVCPGGQGDVSVYRHLLVMSVEQTRGRIDCGTQGIQAPVSSERFRGVRVFDISDLRKPRQVAAVQTCRGSHTHTIVTNPKDPDNLYVYGSGTSTVRSGEELAGCSGQDPKEDPNTALFSIDVIQVPLAAPDKAHIVNRPRIFSDPKTGAIAGLWQGGTHGPGTQRSGATTQCHDITVFPEVGLAAGACAGNGILLDISDPVNPVRLDAVTDPNFAYWHSATFNNDGTKVIFTDEWGGGTRPRCRATDLPNWGADAVFDIVDRKLRLGGYFKMPAPQTETENCVAHNGSLVPVPGRDIMVQAWYQGGVSVFDFTDSAHPVEIAYFDRGPIDDKKLITAGYWSAYWYNGHIYGAEIARGIDVFRLTPGAQLSQNEIDAAMLVRSTEFNVQDQTKASWPSGSVVAKAYVDQLTRSKAIQPERAQALTTALDRVDRVRSSRDKEASEIVSQLEGLATDLERDAGSAAPIDATRLRALAAALKGRTAQLR
jgi:hypothetical protein